MDEMVMVRNFLHVHEAEMAKGVLATEGIDTLLSGDDCGGLRPDIGFSRGVQLLVHASDKEKAEQLLVDKFD